ncbi:N-(5'-phosphoribosyl)anthranilate isomerase [Paenibacillus sp. J31TS4]|uniref:phosphoribosylanthranilate isomerase n=1 Tax=Paenibacillus sp. J31TS4 TaxID=2807195 RepID=UPI001B2F6D36|nr:phosphoribosylanthranilate isomerase [Paenibacillus sp. J31TS4]GIP37460.1 N-(5'-phosphoribosyl)anthranilate isomerase [Paenibacillus sp. J31TS4]
MKIAVKVCGITERGTLEQMKELEVDYIGLLLAPSKRRVTPSQAGELAGFLRSEARGFPLGAARSVGVFVNPSREELAETLAAAPLDVVQLHGEEPPELCRWAADTLGVEVIKALPLAAAGEGGSEADTLAERIARYAGSVHAVLLDTHDPVYGGGSGKRFAWERIPEAQEAARQAGIRLLVAGGLSPDNVGRLLDSYTPDGVDVSSGLETDGRKDADKIKRFVERVKQA